MTLKKALSDFTTDALFERYSNTIYEQEIYELDVIYRKVLYDAVSKFIKRKVIKL